MLLKKKFAELFFKFTADASLLIREANQEKKAGFLKFKKKEFQAAKQRPNAPVPQGRLFFKKRTGAF